MTTRCSSASSRSSRNSSPTCRRCRRRSRSAKANWADLMLSQDATILSTVMAGLVTASRVYPTCATYKRETRASPQDKIVVSGFRHFFDTADGPVQATDYVDLTIRAGEFVTLVGPSGCGKTTLLKALAGFIRPTEGTIECDGKRVAGPGRDRGVVFQELAILPWRTVRRNIGHGLEIVGMPRAEREAKVRRLIDLTGLTGFEDRYPHELSGVMKQRVAVARTWAA